MHPFGGFWVRFVAYIIDAIIMNIAAGVIGTFAGLGIGMVGMNENLAAASAIGAGAISLVINWLYSAILESSTWQATVGKKAMSLVVTDESGGRISFGRATGRYFAKIISSLILLIGFMMVGWTRRKQGLHDKIAGTLVYKARAGELVANTADVFS